MTDQSAKSQDFFQDNNLPGKKIQKNNFLWIIVYVSINKEDFYNRDFIFDVYLLVTKNLNPFSLDRELADKNKHEMIYMLSKNSTPQKFYKHICNGTTVLQPRVLEVITDFMQESKENYKDLRNNLSSYKNIFQYVYSNVLPEISCSTERPSFHLKSNFHIIFKTLRTREN